MKITHWGKDSIFNKWWWETCYPHGKEWSWPSPYTINSRRIEVITVRPKIIQFLEKHRGILLTLRLVTISWVWHQNHRQRRWQQTKAKTLQTAGPWRAQSTEWEDEVWSGREYLQIMYLIRDYCPGYANNSYNSTIITRKQVIWSENGQGIGLSAMMITGQYHY